MTTEEILVKEGDALQFIHAAVVKAHNKHYEKLLEEILTLTQYKELDNYLEDFRGTYFLIERLCYKDLVKSSKKQEEDGYWFKYIFCQQYVSGEDGYHGTIWIPINDELFLEISYEC